MTRLPFLLLGLVAAGLAASIARQLEGGPATDAPPAPVRRPAVAAPAAERPPDRSGDWAAISLARPLFSPDRRPPPPAAAPGSASGPAEPPRLTGILVTPDGRRAIFAGADQPLVLQEGGRIGSYLVQTIAAEQVTILGPSGPRTLRPRYDPRAPGDAAASGGPAVEVPFDANPTPSGLDILRNALRQDPSATVGAPTPAVPTPGAPTSGAPSAGTLPPSGPPGIPGVPPIR